MAQRWPIRLDPVWRPVLLLINARPSTCWVEMDEAQLRVRFGLFSASLPLSEVHGGRRIPWPLLWGVGVRIAPKRTVGYIGSLKGVVRLRLKRPRTFLVILPITRERVAFSLEDPKGFLKALADRIEAYPA